MLHKLNSIFISMTEKQERFAQRYVMLGNASEAYRQAYEVDDNTSIATIHSNAYKILHSTKVTLRVKELQRLEREKYALDKDYIINEYLRIIQQVDAVYEFTTASVYSGDKSRSQHNLVNMVKLSDKLKAVEKLAKMLGVDEKQEDPEDKNVTIEIITVESTHELPDALKNS